MMSNQLTTFDFEENAVRVLIREDEPWFMATDVCRVLELVDVSSALRALDEDEKITQRNERGNPRAGIPHSYNIISESGLYALIFTSRKAKARAFRRWVTSDVLPAIRMTGRYEAEQRCNPVSGADWASSGACCWKPVKGCSRTRCHRDRRKRLPSLPSAIWRR